MLRTVRFQPDYFKSAQFAGLIVAERLGLYAKRGIQLEWMPTCPPGDEATIVSAAATDTLTIGCAEQNILIPAIRAGADVTAVAAMFGHSPLALAALPGRLPWLEGDRKMRVGAHADTVELIQRIFPHSDVVALGRETKLSALCDGAIDAVQIYDVMEGLKLERELEAPPSLLRLEGHSPAADAPVHLGYAQVLFAPTHVLNAKSQVSDQRALVKLFLEATFEGWREASREPGKAAAMVQQAMADAGASNASDHWIDSHDFHFATVERCCEVVARTRSTGMLGVLNPQTWNTATNWLGGTGGRVCHEPSLWRPDPLLVDGDKLAMRMLDNVATEASRVTSMRAGARPKLVVMTVGDAPLGHTHPAAADRLSLARSKMASWFDKVAAGSSLGVDVELIDLDANITTDALCARLEALGHEPSCDGVQLMWPLPPHIDAHQAYNKIPVRLDVDGAHFIGSCETSGGLASSATVEPAEPTAKPALEREGRGWLPVTVDAVLHLLESHNVALRGQRVLVIGRSRLVGMPFAYAMTQADATVTLAHTASLDLAALCREADVVVSAAGSAHLIKGSWIKPGAAVVSVGKSLPTQAGGVPPHTPWDWDIEPQLEAFRHAKLVAGSPGGVGPLSLAFLMRNVVQSAGRSATRDADAGQVALDEHASPAGHPPAGATKCTPPVPRSVLDAWLASAIGQGWTACPLEPTGQVAQAIVRTITQKDHASAAALVAKAGQLGDAISHHPALVTLEHRCTEGVDVTFRLFTTSTGNVTEGDTILAQAISRTL